MLKASFAVVEKGHKAGIGQRILLCNPHEFEYKSWDGRSNKTLGELGLVDSSHTAAQSSLHIKPSRVQVTSEDNFWTTMLRVWPLLWRSQC